MAYIPVLSGVRGNGAPLYVCPKCRMTSATSAQFQRDSAIRGKGGAMIECGNPACRHHEREVRFIPASSAAGAPKSS